MNLVKNGLLGAALASLFAVIPATAHAAPPEAWDKLAMCESTGNWKINTGNGYYGGLQFSPRTWRAFGGKGMPHQASKSEQIRIAERVLAKQGWGAWPACSKKLGLRKYKADPERKSAPTPKGDTYTVKPGDTLSKIAPHNWREVAKKNGIDPHNITIGQVIHL